MLAMFSLTPAIGVGPMVSGVCAAPERFLFDGGGGADPSDGLFLQERWRVPGRLSGPRRFGAASYWQSFDRRTQLLHTGRVESQRILRARL
jgi:hypothetical protein